MFGLTEGLLSGKGGKAILSSMGENALNWGVGGALGGGLDGAFSAATSGLKSGAIGYAADTVGETMIDTVADAAQGGEITPGSVVTSLVFNAVTEGVSSNAAKNSEDRLKLDLQLFAENSDSGTSNNLVNIASDSRTNHILYGDKTGGGHLYPGKPGKSVFPSEWSPEQTMHNISDIVTDPSLNWESGRVVEGVQRYNVTGVREGVEIFAVTDGTDVVTAYPKGGNTHE